MKLPFSFATRFIFRLILPGLVLAVAFVPVLDWLFATLEYRVERIVYIPLAAVTFGWLLLLLDMPIYMLFEGRRYWPGSARKWAISLERKRLERLNEMAETAKESGDNAAPREAELKTTEFPLSKDGKRIASHPTRLGNILREYEEYPTHKYGADGVFYWYRIWVGLPKDLRDELDERQALVDSSLYISFALYISALVTSTYAILSFAAGITLVSALTGVAEVAVAVGLGVSGYLLYRISLPAHVEYGRYFKAMFDRYHADVQTDEALAAVAEMTGDDSYRRLKGREARMAAWRFLQWHLVRVPGETKNRPVHEVADEVKARNQERADRNVQANTIAESEQTARGVIMVSLETFNQHHLAARQALDEIATSPSATQEQVEAARREIDELDKRFVNQAAASFELLSAQHEELITQLSSLVGEIASHGAALDGVRKLEAIVNSAVALSGP